MATKQRQLNLIKFSEFRGFGLPNEDSGSKLMTVKLKNVEIFKAEVITVDESLHTVLS